MLQRFSTLLFPHTNRKQLSVSTEVSYFLNGPYHWNFGANHGYFLFPNISGIDKLDKIYYIWKYVLSNAFELYLIIAFTSFYYLFLVWSDPIPIILHIHVHVFTKNLITFFIDNAKNHRNYFVCYYCAIIYYNSLLHVVCERTQC